jgi:hypothetical protein
MQTTEGDWQYWAWGFADEEKRVMRGIDESVEFIGKIMREQVLPPPTVKGISVFILEGGC